MYAYIGKFTATPGNQNALADRLLTAASRMASVAGCLQYLIYTGADESVLAHQGRPRRLPGTARRPRTH
jgi:quinol monooxygenase YgiN